MSVAPFTLRHTLHGHAMRRSVLAAVALAAVLHTALLQPHVMKSSAGQAALQETQTLLNEISGCIKR